jgi:hypothetical protein
VCSAVYQEQWFKIYHKMIPWVHFFSGTFYSRLRMEALPAGVLKPGQSTKKAAVYILALTQHPRRPFAARGWLFAVLQSNSARAP